MFSQEGKASQLAEIHLEVTSAFDDFANPRVVLTVHNDSVFCFATRCYRPTSNSCTFDVASDTPSVVRLARTPKTGVAPRLVQLSSAHSSGATACCWSKDLENIFVTLGFDIFVTIVGCEFSGFATCDFNCVL